MSDIKKLIRNIDSGIGLRKNLPIYGSILSNAYLDYAAVELTFSAYMLSEMVLEDSIVSEAERALYDQVIEQLRALLESEGTEQMQCVIDKIREIRLQITSIMDGFTSYTDQLIGYDYVLKRKKLHYCTDETMIQEAKRIDEEEFLQSLMAYLVGNSDQSVVRDRLQMLMGQVPVHMTKQKLLEKINEALTLYKGSDKAALDSFVYMIRSSAMLYKAEANVTSAKYVESFIARLSGMDFSDMSAEDYEATTTELEEVTEEIVALTDYYYSLQKVVNGVYALALVRRHKSEESQLYKDCEQILWNVAKGGLDDTSLVKLEGKIEECVEKTSYLEAVLFEVKASHRELLSELELMDAYEDYVTISNLLSDSLFIDLEKAQDDAEVDGAMIKQVYAELSEELSDALSGMQRPLKKAVMAAVMEKLPVDFTDTKQIEDYIRTNLFGCQDISEKGVVLLELQEQMAEVAEWRSR